MLPKLFVLIILLSFVSIAFASWIVGADSGYLGIHNRHFSNGHGIFENASGFLLAGLVEYDFLEFLGARLEAGYGNAAQREFGYDTDIKFKPYFCASLPVVLPNVEWVAGSGKNILNIIIAPGLTYSVMDAKSKLQTWDDSGMRLIYQTVGYKSSAPDLTGIAGIRFTLYNSITIWTEFKIWGEHLTAAEGTPAELQTSQDVTVRTFTLGAGYTIF